MLSLCFVSFKVKDVIALYIKIQKLQNTLIQQHNCFFFFLLWRQIHIFTIKKLKESQENSWSTLLYSIDFRDKKYFYCAKNNN